MSSCNYTKASLTRSIKKEIVGNSNTFNEGPDWVFIPIGPNIKSLAATQVVAQKKVDKLNSDYDARAFGKVVSIAKAVEGTMINIHPTELLVDAINLKMNYKEDEAIQAQLDREDKEEEEMSNVLSNIKDKVFKNKNSLIQYLRESTNPYFYKLVQKKDGWTAELRDDYKWMEGYINKIEDCR